MPTLNGPTRVSLKDMKPSAITVETSTGERGIFLMTIGGGGGYCQPPALGVKRSISQNAVVTAIEAEGPTAYPIASGTNALRHTATVYGYADLK